MQPTTSPASAALPTFDDVFQIDNLGRSFERLLIRHYDVISDEPQIVPGADRIQLRHFKADLDKHLRAIARKATQGRYTYAPFLGVDVPKPGSKEKRPISIATIRDTLVQRALYDYLYPRIDPLLTDSVFGYRVGRSAHAAIAAIRQHIRGGLTSVVDIDLTKFFDTVNHDLLLSKLDALAIDDRARKLVFRFLRTGRVDAAVTDAQRKSAPRQEKFRAAIRTVGVPQGGVLSGMLSNLFLAEFDRLVGSQNPGYVRYADDFVICCANPTDCTAAHALVDNQMRALGMTLNASKTRVCVPITQGIDFLGFRIDADSIRVRGRNIHKFKNRVRTVIANQHKHRTAGATLKSLCRRLNYKIEGPNRQQRERLKRVAGVTHPHRRSWIGFFRIVTDVEQVRALDRWIRKEVSAFMWNTHRCRVRYRAMREAGLCSLRRCLFRARVPSAAPGAPSD
ncbi:MAG: reverse transcriptase domain-containing protein [Vicinamibacterales bacterium]